MAASNGTGRLALWIGIAASGAGFMATMLVAFNTLSNMATQVTSNSTKTDTLIMEVKADEQIIRSLELKLNSVEVSLNEVETQFCADDQMRNVMHATDMRIQSMLWARSFPDSKLPTDNAYYPTICNRKPN